MQAAAEGKLKDLKAPHPLGCLLTRGKSCVVTDDVRRSAMEAKHMQGEVPSCHLFGGGDESADQDFVRTQFLLLRRGQHIQGATQLSPSSTGSDC